MRPLEATRRDLKIGDLWKDPAGCAPGPGQDRWEAVPDEACLETIDRDYRVLAHRRDALSLGRKIGQVLNKERTLLGRKLDRLHEDLAAARQAEVFRKKGELLKTVLHRVRPGDDRVEVTDYESGETVEIPVDPTLSPAANLEAYFSRYHKDARGEKMIGRQVEKLEMQRDGLDALDAQLAAALEKDPPDTEELQKMESAPLVRRLLGRYAPRSTGESSPRKQKEESGIPRRLQPKRFRTGDGLEIWVGRNDEGNDYLTTRLARGNDLFFHLEGYPGSHVILRTEGRTDPPNGSLLDACELAVHFSRLKNAGSADVHVAPVKNIKKPKGAKPGLVYVRQGKTIRLRREPKRLENILASRIDA
jgi:predicted ribosome quality control (RQC) complex YloA/Tae2 family protein